MADTGHVDTDLVGPAGLQAAADVGIAGKPLHDLPVGHRAPAPPVHHRHLLPVRRAAADGGVHGAPVLPEISHRHRLVGPGQGVVLELGGQGLVGEVVLGGDDEAAGVPVDAVDDAGAQGSVDSGE